jgi:dipeptidyl-peptidase III
LAQPSSEASAALEKIIDPLLLEHPAKLGFSNDTCQSNYYPGDVAITESEISMVEKVMEEHNIEPENTRILKIVDGGGLRYHVLQASVEKLENPQALHLQQEQSSIYLERGDHSSELSKICNELVSAIKYAANDTQANLMEEYIKSFRTGSLQAYRRSQKTWVKDNSPRVESIFGFVEPYRDPYGVRAEWEGVICIADPEESRKLTDLVKNSTKYIRLFPWAMSGVNDGKGPFEPTRFQAPEFTIVHCKWFTPLYWSMYPLF